GVRRAACAGLGSQLAGPVRAVRGARAEAGAPEQAIGHVRRQAIGHLTRRLDGRRDLQAVAAGLPDPQRRLGGLLRLCLGHQRHPLLSFVARFLNAVRVAALCPTRKSPVGSLTSYQTIPARFGSCTLSVPSAAIQAALLPPAAV